MRISRARNGTRASLGDGEDRVILSGLTWDDCETLDDALGPDRAGPRLYFLHGSVEVMSTSRRHEELKKWLADLLAQYFLARGVRAFPSGQATLKKLKEALAEPDESWSFGARKEVPDLVLEIALSSGGLSKLEIYAQLGVPEVWLWRKERLEIWTLGPNNERYTGPLAESRALPGVPLRELETCALIEDWTEAMARFHATL